jgi:tetratricopeptide (TPR) repeat protein
MDTNKRNRGVIASRAKLGLAMLNAGIKTQAALAERIAASENIELAPKDTVNRAFRQEKIAPATLARIARVLAVDPESLYLEPQEIDVEHTERTNGVAKLGKSEFSHFKWYAMALLGLLVVSVFWFSQRTNNNPAGAVAGSTGQGLGRRGIVIYPHSSASRFLALAVKNQIAGRYESIVVKEMAANEQPMSVDLARKYQVNAVLTIRITRIGRISALQFFVYSQNVERLIWTDSILTANLQQRKVTIAARFLPVLHSFFGDSRHVNPVDFAFADIKTQTNYMNARALLDEQSSETNIQRAQDLLATAIDAYPGFAHAHAAICESYIEESWNGNEKQLLEEALESCERAAELSPNDSYVLASLARVYRRTGRIPESVELYERILAQHADNVDALSGLGNTLVVAHRQDLASFSDALDRATRLFVQATEVEPDFWRHHSDLGIARYSANDIDAAISSLSTAAQLHPNELSFVNVGTLNFCQGNIDVARDFYRKATGLAPQSHLGYEFLGTVHYFLGEFEESAQFRQLAIDKLNLDGGTHKMWGNLADSHRLVGHHDQAEEAYITALTIIERNELRGNLETSEAIHRIYYRMTLAGISPQDYPYELAEASNYKFAVLVEKDLETSSYIALAKIELLQGNKQNAQNAFARSVSICPIFAKHPVLGAAIPADQH